MTDRRLAAVKVFNLDELGFSLEDVKRECDILQSLKHKNIVQYLGHCYDGSNQKVYLKMELVNDGTLAEHIKRKSLNLSISKSLLADIANGLEYIHLQRILHRDLKPENVLLQKIRENFCAKISDFNLSVQLTSDAASQKSSKVGTSYYFSPERGIGIKYDESADLWAVGCMMIEMALQTRLSGPIWADHPEITQKKETLIQETEKKCPVLGKLAKNLLCSDAKQRFSATQLKFGLTEVIYTHMLTYHTMTDSLLECKVHLLQHLIFKLHGRSLLIQDLLALQVLL